MSTLLLAYECRRIVKRKCAKYGNNNNNDSKNCDALHSSEKYLSTYQKEVDANLKHHSKSKLDSEQ